MIVIENLLKQQPHRLCFLYISIEMMKSVIDVQKRMLEIAKLK
jgi:hypothetical protein